MNHNNDTAAANALDRLLGLAERAVLNDLARVEIDVAIRMRKDPPPVGLALEIRR